MLRHLVTASKEGVVHFNIITAKNRVSKRTVVVNELLSLVLSTAHSFPFLRLLYAEGDVTFSGR